jgi:hypothetical protein
MSDNLWNSIRSDPGLRVGLVTTLDWARKVGSELVHLPRPATRRTYLIFGTGRTCSGSNINHPKAHALGAILSDTTFLPTTCKNNSQSEYQPTSNRSRHDSPPSKWGRQLPKDMFFIVAVRPIVLNERDQDIEKLYCDDDNNCDQGKFDRRFP